MPTGYTESIEKGISFEKFALSCSRAFGALIHMRDESADAPLPKKINPHPYHQEELAKTVEKLKAVKKMTLPQIVSACKKEFTSDMEYYLKIKEEKKSLKKKYDLMLNKARKWNPPTTDHEGLKKFMIEQITSSINSDCDFSYYKLPKIQTPDQYLKKRIKALEDSIAYHKKEWEAEVSRAKERNEWLQSLLKSLKKPTSKN